MADRLPDGLEDIDALAHHGVKGMKWGVITKKASRGVGATKRAIATAGRKTKQGAIKANNARVSYKLKRQQKKAEKTRGGRRSYKRFTDKELNARIKRLEQEQRYRDLKADRHLIRGRKVTREILENGITKAGSYALNKSLRAGFDNAFEKAAKNAGKKVSGEAKAKAAEEAVKAAEKAADAAKAVKREWDARPPASTYKPVAAAKTPAQIERKKSFRQTKPSPKPKRYPRNPGSTAK